MKIPNPFENERGAVLVISLAFMALLAMLGGSAVVMTTTDMQVGANYKESNQALCDAQAGVNYGLGMIETGLKASPVTFTLPTDIGDPTDPSDSNSVALNFTPPTGFGFGFSFKPPGVTMLASNYYSFTVEGTGPTNGSATITVTFTKAIHDPAFGVGMLSEGDISIHGNANVVGGMHANGSVSQTGGGGDIDGPVSAVGTISSGSCNADCTASPSADRIDVPLIENAMFDEWRTKSQTAPNVYAFDPCTYSDPGPGNIYFCDGDLDFSNNLSSAESDVTIIATGNITARGSAIKKTDGKIGLALIAGGNIDFRGGGGAVLNATIWCNGDYQQNGTGTVVGSIVAGGDITRNGTFNFTQDSNIDNENLPPGKECSVIAWRDLRN